MDSLINEIYSVILKQVTIISFFGEYKSHSILKNHYKTVLVALEFASDDSEKFVFLWKK